MMKEGHGQTNQLHDINWGTLYHASHAPNLMLCSYYNMCVCVVYGVFRHKIIRVCVCYSNILFHL